MMFGGPPEGYVPSPAEVEMATMWTPSHEQDAEVAGYFVATGQSEAYTAHILIGKEHGWWVPGAITVQAVPGVFESREGASGAAQAAAEAAHESTGKPVVGGYAWHRKPTAEEPIMSGVPGQAAEWLTHWAVWEDILAVYPVPSWSSRAAK